MNTEVILSESDKSNDNEPAYYFSISGESFTYLGYELLQFVFLQVECIDLLGARIR